MVFVHRFCSQVRLKLSRQILSLADFKSDLSRTNLKFPSSATSPELPKREKVFKKLLDQHFDIYLLQETHLPDVTQCELWEKQWGGHTLWSPSTNRSTRVGLLLNPGSSTEIVSHNIDTDGRVLVKLKQSDRVFQIINVYGPNKHSDRQIFFSTLWHLVFRNVDTIMTGDFNCVPDVLLDKWGGDDTFGDDGITHLHAFEDSLSLEDVFQVKNPVKKLFTWFNGPHLVGCCSDRFYTPIAWRSQVRNHTCDPFSYSDHHMVSIKIQLRH